MADERKTISLDAVRRERALTNAAFKGELVAWASPPDELLPYLVKIDTLTNSQTREVSDWHVLLVAPPNGEAGWSFTPAQAEELAATLMQMAADARTHNGK